MIKMVVLAKIRFVWSRDEDDKIPWAGQKTLHKNTDPVASEDREADIGNSDDDSKADAYLMVSDRPSKSG